MKILLFALALTWTASFASGEALLGTWLSPPDGKGQTGHVVVKPCGAALCGTLERAFDASGNPIVTENVGKQLLIGMRPLGNSAYEGRAYVPMFGRAFDAEITLKGNVLEIEGCMAGAICKTQVWARTAQ